MAFSHYLYYGNYGRPRHKFTKSLWTLSKCLNRTKRLLDFIRMWQRFEIFDNYASIFLQHFGQRSLHWTSHHRLGLIGNCFSVSTDVQTSMFRQLQFFNSFFVDKNKIEAFSRTLVLIQSNVKKCFFSSIFSYTSLSQYSEDSKKDLTVELLILCKNWSILSHANNSFVPHQLYSQKKLHENLDQSVWVLVQLGFSNFVTSWKISAGPHQWWASKKYWPRYLQKILAGSHRRWASKNIGKNICQKKLAGSHRWRVSNWPEMTVCGTIRLWLFIFSAIAGGLFTCGSGLDWKGGEWSSAKGLVAHCCNLFSASILSSELPIEVFSSFGTTRIICWPLFLQQEPLVLQPCG